jgi:hypothetical protein
LKTISLIEVDDDYFVNAVGTMPDRRLGSLLLIISGLLFRRSLHILKRPRKFGRKKLVYHAIPLLKTAGAVSMRYLMQFK